MRGRGATSATPQCCGAAPGDGDMRDAEMRRSGSAGVPFILVLLFLDTLGLGVIIPVLPRLLEGFLDDDVAAASRYYGAFVALYAAMQFFFAPVLGALSDRFGRRPVILTSL